MKTKALVTGPYDAHGLTCITTFDEVAHTGKPILAVLIQCTKYLENIEVIYGGDELGIDMKASVSPNTAAFRLLAGECITKVETSTSGQYISGLQFTTNLGRTWSCGSTGSTDSQHTVHADPPGAVQGQYRLAGVEAVPVAGQAHSQLSFVWTHVEGPLRATGHEHDPPQEQQQQQQQQARASNKVQAACVTWDAAAEISTPVEISASTRSCTEISGSLGSSATDVPLAAVALAKDITQMGYYQRWHARLPSQCQVSMQVIPPGTDLPDLMRLAQQAGTSGMPTVLDLDGLTILGGEARKPGLFSPMQHETSFDLDPGDMPLLICNGALELAPWQCIKVKGGRSSKLVALGGVAIHGSYTNLVVKAGARLLLDGCSLESDSWPCLRVVKAAAYLQDTSLSVAKGPHVENLGRVQAHGGVRAQGGPARRPCELLVKPAHAAVQPVADFDWS
mmetsp:Transcript_9722/g.20735  ORF Transcript_9722/g.20735 Transcript_9722/m.20735 type:complete len:450 (+) Transcript_9722:218-1567(+)|eukprot:CAMPEP_0202904398 /NCGR_PEP_ID=MMETSP1392-20130828/29172_1 /ASSEMBLY_ACC=CAM_ASM_000868 /TAXON_ID=225041 /ORGANISM="Chlamydomonas chlamydogama, Strain SAG 11-48b" /LENGTH=449 /DNA_ID=CAMNT_0049591997 /DNA_START=151 /DNA_END=1500 /DNA_ORIENTATION=+